MAHAVCQTSLVQVQPEFRPPEIHSVGPRTVELPSLRLFGDLQSDRWLTPEVGGPVHSHRTVIGPWSSRWLRPEDGSHPRPSFSEGMTGAAGRVLM